MDGMMNEEMLIDDIDRLEKALKFYADPKNWYRGGNANYNLLYLDDRDPWDIAAKALEDD